MDAKRSGIKRPPGVVATPTESQARLPGPRKAFVEKALFRRWFTRTNLLLALIVLLGVFLVLLECARRRGEELVIRFTGRPKDLAIVFVVTDADTENPIESASITVEPDFDKVKSQTLRTGAEGEAVLLCRDCYVAGTASRNWKVVGLRICPPHCPLCVRAKGYTVWTGQIDPSAHVQRGEPLSFVRVSIPLKKEAK
jgi:hypothetical protein